MTYGSLFSGIGGLDLGFDRAGFTCLWQCEQNPFARRVLEQHWPNVEKHDDVRTFEPTGRVDVVCGGFPCQDISQANAPHGGMLGLRGARSGLWSEFLRIVRVARPRYVVVENVSRPLHTWLPQILLDLSALGYDAEWDTLPVYFRGGHHQRFRTFLVAHPDRERLAREYGEGVAPGHAGGVGDDVARRVFTAAESEDWLPEPRLGRVVDGVPRRVDRLRCLGNAVCPQVAEYVARCLKKFHEDRP